MQNLKLLAGPLLSPRFCLLYAEDVLIVRYLVDCLGLRIKSIGSPIKSFILIP